MVQPIILLVVTTPCWQMYRGRQNKTKISLHEHGHLLPKEFVCLRASSEKSLASPFP